MLPKKEAFVSQVMHSVHRIEDDIVAACQMIDFNGVLRDVEKYGFSIRK